MRLAADLLHAPHLVVDLRVVAGEEGAAVDDHVDLVGAELGDAGGLLDLQLGRHLPGGERGRDRGDLDAAPAHPLERVRDEVRVDAHGGHGRHRQVGGVGAHRLRAERGDLARRVGALERRQVHHPDGEVEREELRLALDRAGGERGRALLDGDLVDGADAREPGLERQLEPARQGGCLSHAGSVALA